MKLYVGNLSFSTTEEALQAEFAAHGQVEEVAVAGLNVLAAIDVDFSAVHVG